MTKNYSYEEQELQQKILIGVDKLSKLVSSTLGPRGKNVLLQSKNERPFTTKDGVTVAAHVNFVDPFENAAAQILKQASVQTNSDAGDGTTTSTVLASNIFKEAQKYLVAGVPAIEITKGIEAAVSAIVEALIDQAKPIRSKEDIANIATISANGDRTIGDLIALAIDKVGKDGALTIEEARSYETSLDFTEGFKFDAGFAANTFMTDPRRGVMKYDTPIILVTDEKIERVADIMPVLEIAARDNRPLIMIAEEIAGQALAACVMNKTAGTMKVACVKAPRYGQERRNILKDLALSTGATFVSRETGMELKKVELKHLGTAKFIEAYKNFTTIVGGKSKPDLVQTKIEELKAELAHTDDLNECEAIQERITRLASGVAVLRIGGKTEVEMIEKKHRVEDALEAVKAAQEEGILEGGGCALLRLNHGKSNVFHGLMTGSYGFECGIKVVQEAIEQPLRTMISNAGGKADLIIQNILNSKEKVGYNIATEEYTDMLAAGVVDPCKVVRCALQNGASVAIALIMTKCAIIED